MKAPMMVPNVVQREWMMAPHNINELVSSTQKKKLAVACFRVPCSFKQPLNHAVLGEKMVLFSGCITASTSFTLCPQSNSGEG